MVLKTSVASMTSTEMITSLASMTSTASLASKNKRTACTFHTEWFPSMRNFTGLYDLNSLINLSGLNDLFSLISSKQNTELDFSINPGTKVTYSGLIKWVRSSKTHYFLDFWHTFFWRLWRTGMLLLTKSKGHK